jgi:hypothetical protein
VCGLKTLRQGALGRAIERYAKRYQIKDARRTVLSDK